VTDEDRDWWSETLWQASAVLALAAVVLGVLMLP
jgi:hypothetical protein